MRIIDAGTSYWVIPERGEVIDKLAERLTEQEVELVKVVKDKIEERVKLLYPKLIEVFSLEVDMINQDGFGNDFDNLIEYYSYIYTLFRTHLSFHLDLLSTVTEHPCMQDEDVLSYIVEEVKNDILSDIAKIDLLDISKYQTTNRKDIIYTINLFLRSYKDYFRSFIRGVIIKDLIIGGYINSVLAEEEKEND